MRDIDLLKNWEPAGVHRRCREMVARAFGVSDADIMGRSRLRPISHARQAAMFVLRKRFVGLSYPCIAKTVGLTDHSSIIYGERQVEERMRRCPDLAAKIARLIDGRLPEQADAHVRVWSRLVDEQRQAQLAARRAVLVPVVVQDDPEDDQFDDEDVRPDPARLMCWQCDRAVLVTEARRCASRFCSLREVA